MISGSHNVKESYSFLKWDNLKKSDKKYENNSKDEFDDESK